MDIDHQRQIKKILSLYSAMIISVVLGIGVSVVNTRFLGPEQFGDYKFIQTVLQFAAPLLTFGLLVSGSRVLAKIKNSRHEREVVGTLLIVAFIIASVLAAGIFLFSFWEESLFNNELGSVFRKYLPFFFLFPFTICLENILQGTSKIFQLSCFRILLPGVYFSLALICVSLFDFGLSEALCLQTLTLLIVLSLMIYLLKPIFKNINKHSIVVWRENYSYGFPVYIGALVGAVSNHFGSLVIACKLDNVELGIFSLAMTVAGPLIFIPSVVGTSYFKEFARMKNIPSKLIVVTFVSSLISLVVFCLMVDKVVVLLYSNKFQGVISLAYYTAGACIIHGAGDFFNRYLGAHGRGADLRLAAIFMGVSSLLGYPIMIHFFGLHGAVMAKVLSSFVYFSSTLFFYVRYSGTSFSALG